MTAAAVWSRWSRSSECWPLATQRPPKSRPPPSSGRPPDRAAQLRPSRQCCRKATAKGHGDWRQQPDAGRSGRRGPALARAGNGHARADRVDAAGMTISAPDGTPLLARYYAPSRRPAPAVLLIHQAGGASRTGIRWSSPSARRRIRRDDVRPARAWRLWWTGGLGADAHRCARRAQPAQRDTERRSVADRDRRRQRGANIALNACADLVGCAAAVLLSPGWTITGLRQPGDAASGQATAADRRQRGRRQQPCRQRHARQSSHIQRPPGSSFLLPGTARTCSLPSQT